MNMKNIPALLITIIIAVSLFSCDTTKKRTSESLKKELQNKSLEEKFQHIGERIKEAMYAGDYDALLEFYTDDVVIMSDFQPAIKGKNALRIRYREQEQDEIKIHAFDGTPDKIWSCENQIYEYGTFGYAASSRESRKPHAYYGSYFMIWEVQQDSSFLIKLMITNLDFNPFRD